MPESSFRASLAAALFLAIGATACGPSGDGGAATTYKVQFTLTEPATDLTALGFSVEYSGGTFAGEGTSVSCLRLTNAGDSGTFDDDDTDTLDVTIVAATKKLKAPLPLIQCNFLASTQPSSSNFTITINDSAPAAEDTVTVVVGDTNAASATGSLGEVTE